MNTLIKPPCTNGRPEDRQPIVHLSNKMLSIEKVKTRYEVQNYSASNLNTLVIIDNWSTTKATFKDIVETITEYKPNITSAEIAKYVISLVERILESPNDEDNLWTVIAEEHEVNNDYHKYLATYGSCYYAVEQWYFVLCDDYDRDYDELDNETLAGVFDSTALYVMKYPVADRMYYIGESLEAGFS